MVKGCLGILIIEKWYNEGKWEPYTPEVLKEVMDYGVGTCPDWIRLPRVIRDIPGVYIQAGNSITNLRQMLVKSRDIRSREIERHSEYYNKPAKIYVDFYWCKLFFFLLKCKHFWQASRRCFVN